MFALSFARRFAATLLLASTTPAMAEQGPAASAWIEVDGNGSIKTLEWSKRSQELSDAVRGAMEAQLRAMSLKPAAEHADAQRVGTTVDITTTLDGDGDDVVLRLANVRTGVTYSKLKPPRFPLSALRRREQADLLAKVNVNVDGKAESVEVVGALDATAGFESEVRDAIKNWRFKNETVDGMPVPGQINVPIRFSMHCQRGDKGFELTAMSPSHVVQVDGNRANADLIEVTASQGTRSPKPCDETSG